MVNIYGILFPLCYGLLCKNPVILQTEMPYPVQNRDFTKIKIQISWQSIVCNQNICQQFFGNLKLTKFCLGKARKGKIPEQEHYFTISIQDFKFIEKNVTGSAISYMYETVIIFLIIARTKTIIVAFLRTETSFLFAPVYFKLWDKQNFIPDEVHLCFSGHVSALIHTIFVQ